MSDKCLCYGCGKVVENDQKVLGIVYLCDDCRDRAKAIYMEYLTNKRKAV